MTMREELISKAAVAMQVADIRHIEESRGGSRALAVPYRALSAAALDTFLAILEDPNEEMVEAGVVAMCGGGGYGERVFDAFRAMLKTLKGE